MILEMRKIGKRFPGVIALDAVDFSIAPGEVVALAGENGAGKSTLMKVLSGVYPHGSYDGEILYDGKPTRFRDIRDSEHAGIVIIHQELALVPLLSVAENLFLGNEVATGGVYGEEGYVYQLFDPLHEFDGFRPALGAWIVGDEAAGLGIRETVGLVTDDGAAFVPHRIPAE